MISKSNSSYRSKVPQYVFSERLQDQEEQLVANPIIKRFAQSRTKMSDDYYRPGYHFVSPESSMNDPNGLCYWNNRWHLFYQAYPPEDSRQHWGHAVSTDLIHWRDLPYAIYPDPEECCFSGAALAEEDRVIAMYHGTEAGNMIAVSKDPLLMNWEKLTGKAVIPLINSDGSRPPYKIFDPCIWKKEGLYYSLSGGSLVHEPSGKQKRAHFLFRSEDLKKWEYMHPFVEEDMFSVLGDDGACPYFWPLGEKHILLHFSHMSGGKYILGDYDKKRDKFIASGGGSFNFGASHAGGVHAPSAAPDGKGGVVVVFNMNESRPTSGWNHIMSLPRKLLLESGNSLLMEPAGDIESLRYDWQHFDSVILPANKEIVLKNLNGNSMEINAEIECGNSPMVELNILRSPDKEEHTRICFYRSRGYMEWSRFAGWERDQWLSACDSLITIDTSYSSVLPDTMCRAPETAPVFLKPDENLKLRVFIDKSVVEVFVNGRQCAAVRVYPGRRDSTGVSLCSRGTDSELVSLEAWQMKSIYE